MSCVSSMLILVRDCEPRSPRNVAVVRVKSCSCFFMAFKLTTTGHLVPRRSPFIVHLTSALIGLPGRGPGARRDQTWTEAAASCAFTC